MYILVRIFLCQNDRKAEWHVRDVHWCVHTGKGHEVLQYSGKAVATISEMPEKVKPQQTRNLKRVKLESLFLGSHDMI